MKRVFRSLIKRPIKNYNVEDRAHKFIEKREKTLAKSVTDKNGKDNIDLSGVTAPKHKSSLDHIERLRKEHPEFMEEQKRKHEGLLDMMTGMVVNPEKFPEIAHRPLSKPSQTATAYDEEFGYKEPSVVPEGKCTIRQAVHFITEYSKDPSVYTVTHIAREYKLEEETVVKVLRHFQTLKVKFVNDPTRYDANKGDAMTPQKLLNTSMKDPKG